MAISGPQLLFSIFIIAAYAAARPPLASICSDASTCTLSVCASAPMPCPRHCRYLGLNSLLNLLNRWALGIYGLRFPLIMTACHMIFGSCTLSPMMMLSEHYSSRHALVLANDWKGLSTIAVMNGFQIACNNASLTVMELSMNQVHSVQLRTHCDQIPALSSDRRPARACR